MLYSFSSWFVNAENAVLLIGHYYALRKYKTEIRGDYFSMLKCNFCNGITLFAPLKYVVFLWNRF